MKTFILSLILISACGMVISQQKTAQSHGESIPYFSDAPSTKGFVIWSEDFASGIPASWTNTTVSGPVDWKYTTVGHTGGFPTAALESSSAGNGWIIIDSDADNFSGGGAEDSHLLTDTIDCTGYANVKLEFQQMFRRWTSELTTIRVTTDGGATFTDWVLNSSIDQSGTPNPDYVNIDISAAIAASPSTVQIEFWWQGAWDYGWQIDDVAVKEIDTNDVLIKNETFNTDIEYYMTPLNHVIPHDFTAQAENIGLTDQTNVFLSIDVNDGTSSVFSDSSNVIGVLATSTVDSLGIANTFTPGATGTYTVSFQIEQDETDLDLSNNSKVNSFEVTDTVYAADNGIYGGEWWNQDTQGLGSDPYHIGVAYEIMENDIATSVSVYVGPGTDIGSFITVELYEYTGTEFSIVASEESDIVDLDATNIGTWVTIPLLSNFTVTAGVPVLASVFHGGGMNIVYVGYGTNSAPGYTLSADDPNTGWLGQPRCAMIRLNLANGVNEIAEANETSVSIYPNPAKDRVQVNCSELETNAKVVLTDLTGKVVYTNSLSAGTTNFEINVNGLSAGMYGFSLLSEKGTVSKRICIR
jgi:hypothetical protein